MITLKLQFPRNEIEALQHSYTVDEKELEAIRLGRAAGIARQMCRKEFLPIAKWKSPRPAQLHDENREGVVRAITKQSFAAVNDVEKVLILTELRGVSVRTATAILHLCFPCDYPLLDVWAMEAFGVTREPTGKWTDLDWLRIWPAYILECRELRDLTGHDLRTIDRALWAFGKKSGSSR